MARYVTKVPDNAHNAILEIDLKGKNWYTVRKSAHIDHLNEHLRNKLLHN